MGTRGGRFGMLRGMPAKYQLTGTALTVSLRTSSLSSSSSSSS